MSCDLKNYDVQKWPQVESCILNSQPGFASWRIQTTFFLEVCEDTLIQVYLTRHYCCVFWLDPGSHPSIVLKCSCHMLFPTKAKLHLGILIKCLWSSFFFFFLQILMNVWLQVLVQMSSAWTLLDLTSVCPAQRGSEAGMDSALVGALASLPECVLLLCGPFSDSGIVPI